MIQFRDVWEMYRIKFIVDGKASWDNFWALKEITFEVKKGECLGIIGENGAGKTTVLKLIAKMLRPDRGGIDVSGRVSGLLEPGAGFEPELTGRDNIYLSGGLFGLSRDQIGQRYAEIADFASLGKFINAPVKCYSQGMYIRLAFSIAIHIEPDILLIDDILTVGDEYFQRKCIKKIFELKERGKTIVLVTHDMSMLRRLCSRAILLREGRLLKDGPVEDVIPLYTQTVGAKEGVSVLGRGDLNLVFNNGRAFLNWREKLLTPSLGMYTVFRIGDRWYSSLEAGWDVDKEGEKGIVAKGEFYQLGLTQVWNITQGPGNTISWDIDIRTQAPLDIQEGCVNIMLLGEYTRWFSSLGKGVFPAIDERGEGQGQLLDDNSLRNCIGVEAERTAEGNVPALAFERSDCISANRAQILNSDYLTNSRILQYKLQGLRGFSATRTGNFRCFSGKIIFDISDIDEYLNKLEDRFTLSCGGLKVVFQNGEAVLFYGKDRLTEGLNVSTSLYADGSWYYSHMGRWDVKKQTPTRFMARGKWHGLPVAQIWEMELTDETSFLWEVYLDAKKEIDIEEARADIACSKRYNHYFSDYGAGAFPREFLEAETDMLQRCIPDGRIGLKDQDNRFPALWVGFAKGPNSFAKIFNSDFYHRVRILRVDRVEPEGKTRFAPGIHKLFSIKAEAEDAGKAKLQKRPTAPCRGVLETQGLLQKDDLRLIFDKGSGRICARGIELTKRLGFYTSLRSGERWHDSYSGAIWKIPRKGGDLISAYGRWLYLPVSQYWEVRFTEDAELEFSINLRVDKEIEVDRMQVNLMLSERYSGWSADGEKGTFPSFEAELGDDWQCIWQQNIPPGDARENPCDISAAAGLIEEKDMPSVILSPQRQSQDWHLKIINSDLYHRGRVLQYLNSEKQIIPPGEYDYFHGRVKISYKEK